MYSIQNSCITTTPLNKTITSIACVLAITAIAIAVIGLTASIGGPFNTIVSLGFTTNGIILGTSIFVLILDLVWIGMLYKNKKKETTGTPPIFQQGSNKKTPDRVENTLHLAKSSNKKPRPQPFRLLPFEINKKIFSYLDPNTLNRCSQVSHEWKKLASSDALWDAFDLKKLFPHLRVFNEGDWENHIDLSSLELSVADAPPSDKRKEISVLKRLLSSLSIEGNSGVTLLTIPKGLTLNKLVKLAGSPKLGNVTNFRFICDRISAELGNIPANKTYRIVITNNVLEASRNLSVSAQKNLILKSGCEMPSILEAATLLVVTYMSSQQRLYNDNPVTYTRCSDQVDGYQLVIGGFAPAGLYINFGRFVDHFFGVGGALEI